MGEIMTADDVAKYLRLERGVVYKLIREGKIPMSKLPTARGNDICNHYRINRDYLDRWLTDRMWANLKKEGLCQ